jgi:dihydrofolate reductase
MRKIVAGLFIALDGVVEAPDQWHFPYFNAEMGAAVTATLGAADTIVFGRKTYHSFAGAWPRPATNSATRWGLPPSAASAPPSTAPSSPTPSPPAP